MESPISRQTRSTRSALLLEYATVTVSLGESVAALISGITASSFALVAFGADSVIEVMSAVVVLIQLRLLLRRIDSSAQGIHASENALGFAVCTASGFIMPGLAWAKRRTATELHQSGAIAVSRLLASDAAETALCGLLSICTLLGVVFTAWLGWWWADPVASLSVIFFAVREGREAWECSDD